MRQRMLYEIIENATVKQLILAVCMSYNLSKESCCLYAKCSDAYYEKMRRVSEFIKIVKLFSRIPPDPDGVDLDTRDRIFTDIGRLFYNFNEIVGKN